MGKNLNELRKRGTELSWKRYMGESIEVNEDLNRYDDVKYWLDNYMTNFLMAGSPQQKEIVIAEKLLNELEEIAVKKDVDLSTLISVYLLEMLERNYPTRVCATGKTKGKANYIINNLYEGSNFIQYADSKEDFKESIFSNRELEKSLSYESTIFDEYIYIERYLMSKNYTKYQIEEIQKEEWEEFGVIKNGGIDMVKPYSINLEYKFDVESLNFTALHAVYVSVRLGLHYLYMKKLKGTSTYEEIEETINQKLKGGEKAWDFYKRFLSRKNMETNYKAK